MLIVKVLLTFLLSLFTLTGIAMADDVIKVENPEKTYKNFNLPAKRIEEFFNSLKTFSADFIQTDGSGFSANGKLVIKRPNKIFLQYDDALPLTVVVNNGIITYYDRKRDQVSFLSAEKTIVSLLVKRVFSFSDNDVKLISQQETDTSITVEFEKTDMPEEGSFRLVFAKTNNNGLDLKQIFVISHEDSSSKAVLNMTKTIYDASVKDSIFDITTKTHTPDKFKK
jgi:outer membrane lipoprotein carrier protein